jgi:hypothetical protein
MLERTFGYVGDALDVPMRMHRPGGARHEPIVVEDAEITDPHVGFVPVLVEAEMPVRVEPAALGVEQRSPRSEDDRHRGGRAVKPRRSP